MEKEIPLSLCASLETTTRVANKKTLLRGGVPTTNKKRERKKSGEMMRGIH